MKLDEILENLRQKHSDATLLAENGRYANAIYLCGYCVELALKYAITKQLNWNRYNTEGKLKFLKVHDLELLVSLTGKEEKLKKLPEWSTVARWNEGIRYEDPSTANKDDAERMIESARIIAEDVCGISL